MKLILASSSPRRKKIFKRLNIPFEIILPHVKEDLISPGANPKKYCISLAEMKANDVSQHHKKELVVGADTIVVINDQILEKPSNNEEAEFMLRTLSGRTHYVYTGVSIQWKEKYISYNFAELTKVKFRTLEIKEIQYYIKCTPPYDKSGAYGIQDWSSIFVEKIEGCYDNVVGFPLSRFYQELRKFDINLLDTISETS